ncbi:MAG: hypothetical protein Q9M91_01200 [Candidatus Dojkabacteria bacterium]|nr:hypothetical protein [Candidatus Dojkabacteria bacterium]MDQ7020441.1 hypothetical protein [Candidatus Dojkabacteria bacterium]
MNGKLKLFVLLTAIFFAGLALRMIVVDFKSMQFDEYYHIAEAQSVLDGQKGALFRDGYNQPYTRGPIVTITTIITGYIFGNFEPWIILPTAIVSSFVSIALFFYLKKYNTATAITAAVAWLFSPLAIAMGSYIREYSFFLLFNTVWSLYFIRQLDIETPINFSKLKVSNKLIALTLIPIVYFLFDFNSTFPNISVIYIGYFISIIIFKYKDVNNYIKFLLSFLLINIPFSVMGFGLNFIGKDSMTVLPHFNKRFFEYIFSGSPIFANYIQEELRFFITFSFLVLVLIGILTSIRSKSIEIKSILFVFIAYIVFYGLYFNRYFEERYYIYIIPWIILLIAIGLNELFSIIRLWLYKFIKSTKAYNLIYSLFYSCFIILIFGGFYFVGDLNIRENVTRQKKYHTALLKDYTVLLDLPITIDQDTAIITPNEHIILWLYSQDEEFGKFVQFNNNNMYYFYFEVNELSLNNIYAVERHTKGYFIVEKVFDLHDLKSIDSLSGKEICKKYEDDEFIVVAWGDCS